MLTKYDILAFIFILAVIVGISCLVDVGIVAEVFK
jgi:hypothetical protein